MYKLTAPPYNKYYNFLTSLNVKFCRNARKTSKPRHIFLPSCPGGLMLQSCSIKKKKKILLNT